MEETGYRRRRRGERRGGRRQGTGEMEGRGGGEEIMLIRTNKYATNKKTE